MGCCCQQPIWIALSADAHACHDPLAVMTSPDNGTELANLHRPISMMIVIPRMKAVLRLNHIRDCGRPDRIRRRRVSWSPQGAGNEQKGDRETVRKLLHDISFK